MSKASNVLKSLTYEEKISDKEVADLYVSIASKHKNDPIKGTAEFINTLVKKYKMTLSEITKVVPQVTLLSGMMKSLK